MAIHPNVLMVLTDDQPLDTLSVMPKTRAWLRDKGRTYTNFFVTTPTCCPSRASIFTGRYAHNHGVLTNFLGYKMDPATTLQRFLRRAGYFTGIFGKYLSGHVRRRPPHFSEWVVTKSQRYFETRVNDNGRRRTIHRYSTKFLSARASAFLEARELDDEVPWFLLVTPRAPHFPFTPEDAYVDAPVPLWNPSPAVRERDTRDKPYWVRRDPVGRRVAARIRRRQLRTLMSVDDLVARLRLELNTLDEARRTLVLFLSDNGFMWGDHGLTGKNLPYSAAVRTPLLIRWPGHIEGGTSDRLVANIDLAPTIFEVTRVPGPRLRVDGRSVLSDPPRKTLLLEHWKSGRTPSWASIRSRSSQFIQYYTRAGKVLFEEFYDLGSDPWQLHNLLEDPTSRNDPRVKRLRRRLAAMRKCAGEKCP